ncbi:hypothetical protein MKW92_047892 [Papaver armeniacum]|nr:hypothetical protein MKW92_047892 [Papaver armeniacum]
MAKNERDGEDDTAIKCDQNPALDDKPVDKLPKVNTTRSFYFVKYRIYQNHELETKIHFTFGCSGRIFHSYIHHAEEEIKNIDQTRKPIRDTILQKKVHLSARIRELRAIFDTTREKGDDTCSSRKSLIIYMEWFDRPIKPDRYSCRSSREEKNLKDMDLDKLKREKQVFSARVKNAKETWRSIYYEIPSLELKLAGTIKKQTAKEELLVKLKKQRNEEKFSYNQQYYNKYMSLLRDARILAAKKNVAALEELSHKEV